MPLVYGEPTSSDLRGLFTSPGENVSLTIVRIELECTFARLLHDGRIDAPQAARLRHEAKILTDQFTLVEPNADLSEKAILLARAHPIDLRSGDALHLAAWQTVSGDDPRGVSFACLDKRLKRAAHNEGAKVLP